MLYETGTTWPQWTTISAIGNSPFPTGVTTVGIRERSAREKIYTNSVAHIMNDETTRKYLQSEEAHNILPEEVPH